MITTPMNHSLYLISGNATEQYPAEMLFGLLYYSRKKNIEIPRCYPFQGEWGCPLNVHILELDKNCSMSLLLHIVWLSIVEQGLYSYFKELTTTSFTLSNSIKNNNSNYYNFDSIVIGMAPYGQLAIWLYGFYKSSIVSWERGEEISGEIRDKLLLINKAHSSKAHHAANTLPRDLFDNYMKQFMYRYLPLFEHWDESEGKWTKYTEEEQETKPVLDFIEEALYDGTHDKLHDGGLLNYHEAGKPKKLALKWHIKKSEYMAYFWFEDEAIRAIFDKFYGIHLETKTDFIIHIDPEKKKYQLSLFRYGLQEPKIIPDEAYQLIVFKNKFEQFRSENYDQPRGAWIW